MHRHDMTATEHYLASATRSILHIAPPCTGRRTHATSCGNFIAVRDAARLQRREPDIYVPPARGSASGTPEWGPECLGTFASLTSSQCTNAQARRANARRPYPSKAECQLKEKGTSTSRSSRRCLQAGQLDRRDAPTRGLRRPATPFYLA